LTEPLILVTNDDGISSPGLWAAANAVAELGEVLVVAPDRQWSGAGRSMPRTVSGAITVEERVLDNGRELRAFAVDATPALCIIHAMLELVPRKPMLVISGINFGENVSTEITISGTIGAALEAATFGVTAIAVSVEMPVEEHLVGNPAADYGAAKAMTYRFARHVLLRALPFDVDVLNINVPASAVPSTPWRLTHLSRRRYFLPVEPDRQRGEGRPGYRTMEDLSDTESGSDVRALRVERLVSVTPLSLDMTARAPFALLEEQLLTAE